MAKKTDTILSEYLEVKKFQDILQRNRQFQKQTFLIVSAAVYIISILFLFSWIRPGVFGLVNVAKTENFDIAKFDKEISLLKKDQESLLKIVNERNSASIPYNILNSKIEKIDASQKALYDSLLLRREDAITAQLLTEKLKLQNEQFISLKEDFRKLNDTLNNIMWTAIFLPLLGIIWSFVKDKVFRKKDNIS